MGWTVAPAFELPVLSGAPDAERLALSDLDGRIEISLRREPDDSNPFAYHASIEHWEWIRIQLPEVHAEGAYSLGFLLDPDHRRWAEIEQQRVLEAPTEIEPIADAPGAGERRGPPHRGAADR